MTQDIAQYLLHAVAYVALGYIVHSLAAVARHDERIKALEKSVDKLEKCSPPARG